MVDTLRPEKPHRMGISEPVVISKKNLVRFSRDSRKSPFYEGFRVFCAFQILRKYYDSVTKCHF